MTILPYKKDTLHTTLTKEDIAERLNKHTTNGNPGSIFPNRHLTTEFTGNISQSNFSIIRNINYRNSFLPIISGHIKNTSTGTNIEQVSKPVTFVTTFITLWMGGVFLGCIIALYILIMGNNPFNPAFLAPFIMLIFGFLLTNIAFTTEYNAGLKKLKEILEAKTI